MNCLLTGKDVAHSVNYDILQARKRKGALIPDEVKEEHFWLLIGASSIHSERIIQALRDYLVLGRSRKHVCEQYGINNGYFSTSLNRLQYISQIAAQMVTYYL